MSGGGGLLSPLGSEDRKPIPSVLIGVESPFQRKPRGSLRYLVSIWLSS